MLLSVSDWTSTLMKRSRSKSIGEEMVIMEKGNIDACQAFIKKHSQNLHPNHYYLQVIVRRLEPVILDNTVLPENRDSTK